MLTFVFLAIYKVFGIPSDTCLLVRSLVEHLLAVAFSMATGCSALFKCKLLEKSNLQLAPHLRYILRVNRMLFMSAAVIKPSA